MWKSERWKQSGGMTLKNKWSNQTSVVCSSSRLEDQQQLKVTFAAAAAAASITHPKSQYQSCIVVSFFTVSHESDKVIQVYC